MSTETTKNLLPDLVAKKLELSLVGNKISFRDIEIAFGKTVDDLNEEISQKLYSVSTERAVALWNALDEHSKHSLVFSDLGTFNLDLIEKLNLNGRLLCEAFISKHAKFIFHLNTVPLFSASYGAAFTTLQSELLSACKQLFKAGSSGKQCLFEFLESFDVEFLASMVRHEIARYYVDENGTDWQYHIDTVETEDGFCIVADEEGEDDTEEFDGESDELTELEEAFLNGDTVSQSIQLTYWLQNYATEIFLTIRNLLTFFSQERGTPIWERPNPTKNEKELDLESPDQLENQYSGLELGIKGGNEDDEAGGFNVSDLTALISEQGGSGEPGIVSVQAEKEFRRLIRLYAITNPLRKNFAEIDNQSFEQQGEVIARILRQSGADTRAIQTFGDLRKALWDVIGFSEVVTWVNQQDNPDRLIDSSGKRELFNQMKFLSAGIFTGTNAVFFLSLEESREQVNKLYGWLSLVAIFWKTTSQQRRFIDLASIINDKIVWEEGITVCTLIFQAVLNKHQLFFSLDDVVLFCEKSRERGWTTTMKSLFRVLAEENNAQYAVPIFDGHIDHLAEKATNIFYVADCIKLSTSLEMVLVQKVREKAEEYKQRLVDESPKKAKRDKIDTLRLYYAMAIAQIMGIGKYKKEADRYFDDLISNVTRSHSFADVMKLIKCKKGN